MHGCGRGNSASLPSLVGHLKHPDETAVPQRAHLEACSEDGQHLYIDAQTNPSRIGLDTHLHQFLDDADTTVRIHLL